MKLSDYVIDFVAKQGVRHAFVLSGGASVHLIDSIARHEEIDYICPQHEQAGAMMADAYARETGKLGVCVTTSGPGATNLITGICCSWFDSIPTLMLTGQVSRSRLSQGTGLRQLGFQETDIVQMCANITKYAVLVTDPQMIRYELEKAVYLAFEGRPGPVILDLPDDLQREEVDPAKLKSFTPPPVNSDQENLEKQVDQILAMLERSERPVVVLGGGIVCSRSQHLAQQFVEKLSLQFCPTWATFDMIDHDHPLFSGGFGITSVRWGNFVIQNCDFVLSLGSRLDTHATGSPANTFARGAKKALVDIDPLELEKFPKQGMHVDLSICANVADVLKLLLLRIEEKKIQAKERPLWKAQIQKWRADFPVITQELRDEGKERVESYLFLDTLSRKSKEGDIIYVDCGGNLTQTMQGYKVKKNQRLVTALNNSPMGYALSGAIGASIALGNREILCITGDMGLLMNIQEYATIQRLQLPIKIFIFNNEGHGIVRQTQNDWLGSRHESTDHEHGLANVNFVEVSKAFGIPAIELKSQAEVDEKLEGILRTPGPMTINLAMGYDQKTIPFLKFGRPIEDANPLLDRKAFLDAMLVEPLEISTKPI
jgi:acetolactate synthase-1/2/3 large subunit